MEKEGHYRERSEFEQDMSTTRPHSLLFTPPMVITQCVFCETDPFLLLEPPGSNYFQKHCHRHAQRCASLTSEVSVGLIESVRLTSTVSNGGGREKGERALKP